LLHVCPLVVQSLHVPPKLPHVVLLARMHDPPWQQPFRQLRRLQLPVRPPLEEPDELPDELPLDDPLDEPLVVLLHAPA
jgi:hypothetical protein